MAIIDSIISAESGGDQYAKNPNSTALGPAQFIESTWLATIAKHRPDLMEGRSRDDLLALRTDVPLARDMATALASDNAGMLAQAGLPVTPGSTYLAHFAGPKGAIGILNADPTAPAGSVLGERVVKANPFLANMTAADLKAWAERKMGGKAADAAPSVVPLSLSAPAISPATNGEATANASVFADDPAAIETPRPNPFSFAALQAQQSAAEQNTPPPMLLPPRQRPNLSRSQALAASRGFSLRA